MRRHTFVAANFFMLKMLNLYRKRSQCHGAAFGNDDGPWKRTVAFLQSESARVSIRKIDVISSRFINGGRVRRKFNWAQTPYRLPVPSCMAPFRGSRSQRTEGL